MRRLLAELLLVGLILGMLSTGIVSSVTANETDRNGSFTTDRGTAIGLNATLEHDGAAGATPELDTNTKYSLFIEVTLNELGNESRDFHDLEFTITIELDGLLNDIPVYSAYYFDSTTELTEKGQSVVYEFELFISAELEEAQETNLDIVFKGTEDIENRPDVTTEFDNLGYIINVNPGPSISTLSFSGNTTEDRTINQFTEEGTEVEIAVDFEHEGLTDGKPSVTSNQFYQISVNMTLVDLGADAKDIHDLEVEIVMVDSSITDLIPGQGSVSYFNGYGKSTVELNNSESEEFNFALFPATNINNTEVELKFTFRFKEDIAASLGQLTDPETEIPMTFEVQLNKNLTNLGFNTEEESIPFNLGVAMISLFIIIPLIRRRKNK